MIIGLYSCSKEIQQDDIDLNLAMLNNVAYTQTSNSVRRHD